MRTNIYQPEGNYFNKYENKNKIVRLIMNNFYKNIATALQPIESKNIFDAGCGEGYISNFIAELNNNALIEGMDISEKVVTEASSNYPKIHFEQGSIYDIKRDDSSFDLVIASEVLEHLEDPKAALKELFRISKLYVFISVPNEPIWRISNFLRGKYLTSLGNTPGHIQHWSKKQIIKQVNEFGEVIDVKSPFPWTMIVSKKIKG